MDPAIEIDPTTHCTMSRPMRYKTITKKLININVVVIIVIIILAIIMVLVIVSAAVTVLSLMFVLL